MSEWTRAASRSATGSTAKRRSILDGRFQYIHRFGRYQAGLFLEIYNLTESRQLRQPDRSEELGQFLIPIAADNPRTAQLGFRLTF